MKFLVSVTLLAVSAGLAVAQYDSPAPPRLQIPGAVPIVRGGLPANAFRTDRLVPGPVLVRTRRPLLKGRVQQAQLPPQALAPVVTGPVARAELEAKPVTEEPEEESPFAPHLLVGSSPQPPPLSLPPPARAPQPKLLPQSKFFEPNSLGEDDGPILARFQPQERPTAVPVQLARFNAQPAPQKIAHRPTPAAYHRQQEQEEPQQQQRVREPVRPTPRYNNHDHERERKPVAQILRKYREEHEDGTITWGFENDDGSFKEESIGIDCVTRGRYGYVDPDGNKREYSYETGIQCDPNKRDEEEAEEVEEQEYVPQVKHFKRPQQQQQQQQQRN